MARLEPPLEKHLDLGSLTNWTLSKICVLRGISGKGNKTTLLERIRANAKAVPIPYHTDYRAGIERLISNGTLAIDLERRRVTVANMSLLSPPIEKHLDLESLTNRTLSEICALRGISKQGIKPVLCDRIRANSASIHVPDGADYRAGIERFIANGTLVINFELRRATRANLPWVTIASPVQRRFQVDLAPGEVHSVSPTPGINSPPSLDERVSNVPSPVPLNPGAAVERGSTKRHRDEVISEPVHSESSFSSVDIPNTDYSRPESDIEKEARSVRNVAKVVRLVRKKYKGTFGGDDGPAAFARGKYSTLRKIGEGVFASVFQCLDTSKRDLSLVAVKRIRLDKSKNGISAGVMREVSALRELRHGNIVTLLDVVAEESAMLLVFEVMYQDLSKLIRSRPTPMAGRRLKCMAYQLLDGLAACHARRLMHRDLKPQNILVSEDGAVLKLADFGIARAFHIRPQTYTHEVITLWYRPPEILLGTKRYGPSVDVWSAGCIIAEMATGEALVPGDCEVHTLMEIFQLLGTPTEEVWPGVSALADFHMEFPRWAPKDLLDVVPGLGADGVDLLQQLLTYDPARRITAAAALRHRWFDDVRGSQFEVDHPN